MVISMAQNVYMLSMAFLVPLRRLKAKYVCPQTKEDKNDDRVTALDTPFVLYPNASCRCWVIEGGAIYILSLLMCSFFVLVTMGLILSLEK